MIGFKRAIGPDGHIHVVYLNEEQGFGIASPAEDGHVPVVQYQPAAEAQLDEMGNEIAPATPEQWIIVDENGQPHQLAEIPVVIKSKKSKETARDVWELWRACRGAESESLDDIRKNRKFYTGEQWENGDKTYLHSMNRAALTVNMAGKQIDELSGMERQQRTEFKLLPVEASDQRATDMYQALVKQVANQSFYSIAKSSAFKDALIGGRGWLNLAVDFVDDILGTITLERWNPEEITAGPHDDLTLKDCELLFKERWYSLDKLKSLWGDKVKELEVDYDYMSLGQIDKKHQRYLRGGQYAKSDNWQPIGAMFEGYELCDVVKKQYRVIECWRRVYDDVVVVGHVGSEHYEQAIGWPETDIQAIQQMEGCIVIKRNLPKIRITRVAGNVILSDENPADLPADTFFCVPIYAYKDGAKFYGKMAQIYDLQMGLNKVFSLSVDILNKTSSWLWWYDSATFPDNEKEKFKQLANQPGAVIEVNDVNRTPKKEEGTRFPAELSQLMQLQMDLIQTLGNVTPEAPGANTSAQAILQRQKQVMKGNEELFDNLSLANQALGRLLLKTIKRYYSPERILRVLQQAASAQKFMVGDRTFDEWTREEIIDILEKNDIEKYDIIVTEADSSPSAMLGTNLMLADLAGKGIPIPPQALIETAPLPEKTKERLLGYLTEQNEAQAQGNQVAADAEIKKTLIAKGFIPPDVQEQYLGQQPQGGVGVGQPLPPAPDGSMPMPDPMQQQQPQPQQQMQQMPQMPAPMADPAMEQMGPPMEQPAISESALAMEMQQQQINGALQQMASSIAMLADILAKKEAAPAQQPNITIVNGKPSMQVGTITRDPTGMSSQVQLRSVESPDGVPA